MKKMNKTGGILDIIIFMIVSFVLVIVVALFVYGISQLNLFTFNAVNDPALNNSIANLTYAQSSSFGELNSSMVTMRWVALFIIFGLIMSIFISNFLVKANPAFFIIYIFITLGAFMASLVLSNSYEGLTQDPTIGPTLLSFTGSTFILLNLPYFVTVIGLIGAAFLYMGIQRDEGSGGSIA